MSGGKYDRVVIHIGPYKTGSTSIQANLHDLREELLARGVSYRPDTGFADNRLGKALAAVATVCQADDSGWWVEGLRDDQEILRESAQACKNARTRIFSCETLCDASPLKARSWMHMLPAHHVEVVAMMREPLGWLISAFYQEATCSVIEWVPFVRQALKGRRFFISRLHALWKSGESRFRLIPLLPGRDVWADFCSLIQAEGLTGKRDSYRARVSPAPAESVCTATACVALQAYIPAVEAWAGKMQDGFVMRVYMDIVDTCRPFHEYSRTLGEAELLERGVLQRGASPLVREYRQAWLDDLAQCIEAGLIDPDDMSIAQEAFAEYRSRDVDGLLFPAPGFRDRLPIDAEWESRIRLLAGTIGLCHKMRNAPAAVGSPT